MGNIERSEADKGPRCDCFSGSVIDERRHAPWCPRRLWTERNDARDQLRGAVDRAAALERMLARVLPYVHAEPHAEHSALHDEAKALLDAGGQ